MAGNGKKVLLHACCGPCSIMCIQSLRDEGYDVTGYFANPNIHPVSEYFRRREAMEQVAEQMDLPMLWQAGIDRSKEMGLYRQNYCACIFSEYERFEKKLRKLSAE